MSTRLSCSRTAGLACVQLTVDGLLKVAAQA